MTDKEKPQPFVQFMSQSSSMKFPVYAKDNTQVWEEMIGEDIFKQRAFLCYYACHNFGDLFGQFQQLNSPMDESVPTNLGQVTIDSIRKDYGDFLIAGIHDINFETDQTMEGFFQYLFKYYDLRKLENKHLSTIKMMATQREWEDKILKTDELRTKAVCLPHFRVNPFPLTKKFKSQRKLKFEQEEDMIS